MLAWRPRAWARAVEPALAAGIFVVVGYGVLGRLIPGILHEHASFYAGGRLDQPWMRLVALASVLPVVGVVVLRRRTALADAKARGAVGGDSVDERAAGTAPGEKVGFNVRIFDKAKLVGELRTRYLTDFAAQWRKFLQSATVSRYAGIKDAAQKLRAFSGNQSPLLALFSIASQNTDIGVPEITAIFQPPSAAYHRASGTGAPVSPS